MTIPKDREYTFCVYASSSAKTPQPYLDAARDLGNLLVDGGHATVNGAGRTGGMGALNDAVCKRAGKVRGVIHEMWVVDRKEHPDIKDIRVVGGHGLQERKRVLTEGADCIVVLPGGIGTWDELWEMVCLKGIGLCNLPICVLDVNDFYAGFRMQAERAQTDGLLWADLTKLLHFESDPSKAVKWCISQLDNAKPGETTVQPLRRTNSSSSSRRLSWWASDPFVFVGSVVMCSGAIYCAMAALRR